MFTKICNIIPIKQTSHDQHEVFDIYVQNFFIFAYSRLTSDNIILYEFQDDSWISKDKIDGLIKEILIFENEVNIKKITSHIFKYSKVIHDQFGKEIDGINIDNMLQIFLDAYRDVKARNIKILSKNFYKYHSNGEGVFSFDEYLSICNQIFENEINKLNYQYPKEFTISRAFIYSLTSSRNNFSITYKDFFESCSRFGIDSPFPFIRTSKTVSFPDLNIPETLQNQVQTNFNKDLKKISPKSQPAKSKIGEIELKTNIIDADSKRFLEMEDEILVKSEREKKRKDDFENKVQGSSIFKIDPTSSLFAQHFSILRELRIYCINFKDMMKNEANSEVLWKNFTQILQVLETGCHFLMMPINT